MKRLVLLFILLPLICSCGNSVFYNQIEDINKNYSFKLYIYGDMITEETHKDNLPDNLNYEYIDTLDIDFDFNGIFVLLITKDINNEEIRILSDLFMENINILFYNIHDYREDLMSIDFDFGKYRQDNKDATSILFCKSKGPYFDTNREPTIWSMFDMIEKLLKKYN